MPTGLIVPVLRDADEKNLAGLAARVNDLAARARGGQLLPDDVHGGTFTVTNHGTGGSLFATPIINQPQTGILGVGAIVKRPVVRSQTPHTAAQRRRCACHPAHVLSELHLRPSRPGRCSRQMSS